LNCRSPLPSMFRLRVAPTFGGLLPRPAAIPIVMVIPASAAHTHCLLNHRAMTICLRAMLQKPSVACQGIRA
jgi:hypothetical protein